MLWRFKMSIENNFHTVARMYETIWQHNEKPIWIVEYKNEHTNKIPTFRIYRVKDYELPLKKGKRIWAHDNELIGNEHGYASLNEAMTAVV